MSEQAMTQLQANHLEIAARAWAGEQAREIAGIVVDHVLNQTQATIPLLDLIPLAQTYEERFLTAWLKRNLLEFTRAYMSDVEERQLHIEKQLHDATNVRPSPPIKKGEGGA